MALINYFPQDVPFVVFILDLLHAQIKSKIFTISITSKDFFRTIIKRGQKHLSLVVSSVEAIISNSAFIDIQIEASLSPTSKDSLPDEADTRLIDFGCDGSHYIPRNRNPSSFLLSRQPSYS